MAPQGQGTLAEQVAQKETHLSWELENSWQFLPFVAGIHSEGPKMVQGPPHRPHTSLSNFSCCLRTQKCGLMDIAHYFREGSRNRPGIPPAIQVLGRGCGSAPHLQLPRAAGGGSPLPGWPWPESGQHSILLFRGLPPHSNHQLGLRWALFPGQGSWSPLTLRLWVETI